MTECRYDRPLTLDAALGTLAASGGEASIMAGGVALGILMNEKLAQPTHLLDISRVRELRGIESRPDGVRIGALGTHHAIESSPVIRQRLPALAELAAEIACGRVKNRGTIGGNVCLADPQADMPVAALALRARFQAASRRGMREIPAVEFFVGVVQTALEPDELLQSVFFPALPAHTGVAFGKFSARKAMDYSSTVTVGVRVTIDPKTEVVTGFGLGLGGMGVTPVWPKRTEALFAGARLDDPVFRAARETLAAECDPIDDDLYSAEYKTHVCSVMLKRTATRALARAKGVPGGKP
ncbi:MAG: FAD binding domain-containing protein [Burkholderiales bacterium]|nr:FAD binding domain-containing protein [Burkholderiales bacterium]